MTLRPKTPVRNCCSPKRDARGFGTPRHSAGRRIPVACTPVGVRLVALPSFRTRRAARTRAARIVLLQRELDTQGARSVERTRTIETKAAYTLTANAVLVAASISLIGNGLAAFFALCALALSAAAIVHATRAIRLLELGVPSAGLLVDTYVDLDVSAGDLEDRLLEVRRQEIEKRDGLNEDRSRSLKLAFRCLWASVAVLLLAAILTAIPMTEGNDDGEPRRPEISEATPAA